jgi:hypothetical protein
MSRVAKSLCIGFFGALVGCTKPDEPKNTKMNPTELHEGDFGTCCDDLSDCMAQPNSMFRVEENGTLFLTIGYVETEQGPGWFDQAVIFCPFCGKRLQDRATIAKNAADPSNQ